MALRSASRRPAVRRRAAAIALLGGLLGVSSTTGCGAPGRSAVPGAGPGGDGAGHGLVLARTTAGYLIVLDVAAAAAPGGDGAPRLELHVYDRRDGRPAVDVRPALTLVDERTGSALALDATLVPAGSNEGAGAHFGADVAPTDGRPFTLRVSVGTDTTEFAGVRA